MVILQIIFLFLCFWTFQKGQKEDFHASERFRKAKWRIFMLLNISERANGGFSCFWTFQKEQMEIFYASERLRKAKWSFFVLLSDSERPNGVFPCFWATHKGQMEFFRASERLRKTKWSFFVLLSDSETQKRSFWMSFSIFLLLYEEMPCWSHGISLFEIKPICFK